MKPLHRGYNSYSSAMANGRVIIVIFATVLISIVCCQKPCCTPEKWTAHLLKKTGTYQTATYIASKADISTYIYYDYTVKKLALQSFIRNTTFKFDNYTQRIVDYEKGMEWRIDGKNCTRHQVTKQMRSPCFLDGAKFYGYHNINNLPVEVWFQDDGKGHTVRTTMSREPCVPVTDTYRSMGPELDYELSFGIYENVTVGYVYPGVFDIPSFCPRSGQVYMEQPKKGDILPWHEQFRRLFYP